MGISTGGLVIRTHRDDKDIGPYVCDIFYYNTWTWWNSNDDTITKHSRCLDNAYDIFLRKMNTKGEIFIMNGSDGIVSMLWIKREIIASITYYFCTGKSVSKAIENINEILAVLKISKKNVKLK